MFQVIGVKLGQHVVLFQSVHRSNCVNVFEDLGDDWRARGYTEFGIKLKTHS